MLTPARRPYDGKVRLRIPGRLAWAVAGRWPRSSGSLLVLVHTPPAARWSRDWIVRQVADRWQLDLATSRRRLQPVHRARVARRRAAVRARPRRRAVLHRRPRDGHAAVGRCVRGIVRLSNLEVDAGRVLLVRERGMIVNLPPLVGRAAARDRAAPRPARPAGARARRRLRRSHRRRRRAGARPAPGPRSERGTAASSPAPAARSPPRRS